MNLEMITVVIPTVLLVFLMNKSMATPLLRKAPLSFAAAENDNSYMYYEPNGPGTYAFGYNIEEPDSDNVQFRDEEKHANGTVTGSYGYVGTNGHIYLVRYIADEDGYRATIEDNQL